MRQFSYKSLKTTLKDITVITKLKSCNYGLVKKMSVNLVLICKMFEEIF